MLKFDPVLTVLPSPQSGSILHDMFSHVVERLLAKKPAASWCWFRTKDRLRFYIFNRTRFVNRIGDKKFIDLLYTFEKGAGGVSERGFVMYHRDSELLIACSIRGTPRRPKIVDSKVAKVQETDDRIAVVEVPASPKETDKLVRVALLGERR